MEGKMSLTSRNTKTDTSQSIKIALIAIIAVLIILGFILASAGIYLLIKDATKPTTPTYTTTEQTTSPSGISSLRSSTTTTTIQSTTTSRITTTVVHTTTTVATTTTTTIILTLDIQLPEGGIYKNDNVKVKVVSEEGPMT
jgi:cytoskeletal protein RodZ